eukprot:m.7921 g.7921  ORF g.7921 m.7921 type:complete len:517 (+) comp5334_c0_seq1:206-1756(+)
MMMQLLLCAWICFAAVACRSTVNAIPVASPYPTPKTWAGTFTLELQTFIPSEDVLFTVTISSSESQNAARVHITSPSGNDTQYVVNKETTVAYASSRLDGLQCSFFRSQLPLPAGPNFAGFTFLEETYLNGQLAYHFRAITQTGFKLGLYTNSTGFPLLMSSFDGMGAITTVVSYSQVEPDPSVFALPTHCIEEPTASIFSDTTAPLTRPLGHVDQGVALKQNMDLIWSHTSNSTYSLKPNLFAHLPFSQFAAVHLMHPITKMEAEQLRIKATGVSTYSNNSIPPNQYDSRALEHFTPVRDQSQCGGCWAFASVAALEVQRLLRFNISDAQLSPQNLLDCVPSLNGEILVRGCFGGWPLSAYQYIQSVGGVATERAMPFQAVDHNCPISSISFASFTAISTVYSVKAGDVRSIENAVSTYGGVVAIIDVLSDFVFYQQGVYSNPQCTGDLLSHAVTIVGFGTTVANEPYWLVKNSFGGNWGEGGYFRMARGINMCGIEANVAFAALSPTPKIDHQE